MNSDPNGPLSRDEQILRHPVCGPLARRAADEQRQLTLDMLADEPAASRAAVFHKATLKGLAEQLPALSAGHVACGPGCATCCCVRVEVQAFEAMGIAGFLRKHRTPEELAALTAALRQRVRQVGKLTSTQQTDAHLRCLFLDQKDWCSIHPVRPIHCMGVTVTSRERCEGAFGPGEGAGSLRVYGPVMAYTQGVLAGTTAALRELGLDAADYELNAAVLAAMETPDAAERWLRGERAFSVPAPAAKSVGAARPVASPLSRNAPCPCGSGKKYKQCCLWKESQGL